MVGTARQKETDPENELVEGWTNSERSTNLHYLYSRSLG